MPRQTTNTILMIAPDTFGYNHETAVSNVFQTKPGLSLDELREKVSDEFDEMVEALTEAGIDVFQAGLDSEEDLPDAVFPNNWFATYEDGTVVLFPMLAENRRKERDRSFLEEVAESGGYKINNVIDLSKYETEGLFLEGTGSLVIDRKNNAVFAITSDRTNETLFNKYCEMMNVPASRRFLFHGAAEGDKQIYHTNVMMSIGDGFAVICEECISSRDRIDIISAIETLGHEIIDISLEQMNNFCGNVLNLVNVDGESLIVMSGNAKRSFEPSQLSALEKFGKIVEVNIDTIESVGGGSARCMMAEIFLPKA